MFYKSDLGPSGIETLLDEVDAVNAMRELRSEPKDKDKDEIPDSITGCDAFSNFPEIEKFLDEEDITRECRGDNKRLIAYLCRPEVISALVAWCIDAHGSKTMEANTSDASTESDAVTNHLGEGPTQNLREGTAKGGNINISESAASSHVKVDAFVNNASTEAHVTNDASTDSSDSDASVDESEDDARKARLTRSYIASELLSADVRPLADALVREDRIMNDLFSCLNASGPGELDLFVATHFAKIISSLLKTRNNETLQQMTRCKDVFIPGLLKHIALPPIAELIVRILDGPEVERGYATSVVAPSQAALDLLVQSDILSGLADRFVAAAKMFSASPEDSDARRLQEETLTHTTAAIQDMATRILQLLSMDTRVPAKLNPYSTPGVVVCMLDAGLASHSNFSSSSLSPTFDSAAGSLNNATHLSLAGSSSALLHALSLAAKLMTTDANVYRDEGMDQPAGFAVGPPGIGGSGSRQMLFGMASRGRAGSSYGRSGGIAASIQAQKQREEASMHTSEIASNRSIVTEPSALHDSDSDDDVDVAGESLSTSSLQVGSPIASTVALEAELVRSFKRLSEMFGSDASDEADGRPLGSLRLKLAEFFVACMKKASQSTVDAIVKLEVPKKLIGLFLRYEWSSMLHGVVTRSIVSAFEGISSSGPARKAWIDADLIPWLTEAWALNERKAEAEEYRFRAGYMGHLIQIGFAIQRFVDENVNTDAVTVIPPEQRQTLREFGENHLKPAHEIENTPLGGERPGHGGGTSDGEDVYEEATEVFDMGEVVEGMTQGDPNAAATRFAKYIIHRSEEEEEVEPVDIGDLSHFGPDGNDDDSDDVEYDDEIAVVDASTVEGRHEPVPGLGKGRKAEVNSASPKSRSKSHSPKSLDSSDSRFSLDSKHKRQARERQSPRRKDSVELIFGSDRYDAETGKLSDESYGSSYKQASSDRKDLSQCSKQGKTADAIEPARRDESSDDEGTYEEFVDAPTVYDDDDLLASMKSALNLGPNARNDRAYLPPHSREANSNSSSKQHVSSPTGDVFLNSRPRPAESCPPGSEDVPSKMPDSLRSAGRRSDLGFIQDEVDDSSEDDTDDWVPFDQSHISDALGDRMDSSETKNST